MKHFALLVLTFFAFSLCSAEVTGKVVGITDGDTITLLDDLDKGVFRIRLAGIDAPEKKQPYGNKAKQFLSSLVSGRQVSVRFREIDRYGRMIGIIFCGGTEINLEMVRKGFAWHYARYDRSAAYIEAEKQARREKKGLWADKTAINPHEFRKMQRHRH